MALCRLVNMLQPGCCPPPNHRKLPFIQMENIGHYLRATDEAFGGLFSINTPVIKKDNGSRPKRSQI